MITLTGGLAGLAFAPWLVLLIGFLGSEKRRPYLWRTGSSAAVREATAVRQMGLTYTALVFAGLALASSPGSTDRSVAVQLLVVALAAAAGAWAVSNLGALQWAADVAEAGLLLSVATILLAMGEILWSRDTPVRVTVVVSIGIAYVVVFVLSVFLAHSHWREAKPDEDGPEMTYLVVGDSGKYHFVLKSRDGTTIATSERYPTLAAATLAIELVRQNAAAAKVAETTG